MDFVGDKAVPLDKIRKIIHLRRKQISKLDRSVGMLEVTYLMSSAEKTIKDNIFDAVYAELRAHTPEAISGSKEW